jgi:hypothetical protein
MIITFFLKVNLGYSTLGFFFIILSYVTFGRFKHNNLTYKLRYNHLK